MWIIPDENQANKNSALIRAEFLHDDYPKAFSIKS